MRIEKTVFISYRRTNLPWAIAIYQYLTSKGYDVFFDYQSINSGDFGQIILGNIRARAHFLVILTPSALERCSQPGDWLRCEIETALDEKRNIVPLFLEGFSFSSPTIEEYLTGNLSPLKKYNGINIPPDYFDAAMDRLHNRFLNVPLDAILHPLSFEAQKVSKNQQAYANMVAHINTSDLRKSVDFAQPYTFLFGRTGSYIYNIPPSLLEALKTTADEGHEFKSIALGPDSSYVFLFGKTGSYVNNIPPSLLQALRTTANEGHEFKSIALGPDSSYVFLFGKTGSYVNNIPPSLLQALKTTADEGYEFKSVALGPDSSYVFLFGNTGSYANNIPPSLLEALKTTANEGYEFKSVALGPDSSYVFLFGNTGSYVNNIPPSLLEALKTTADEGHEFQSIALG